MRIWIAIALAACGSKPPPPTVVDPVPAPPDSAVAVMADASVDAATPDANDSRAEITTLSRYGFLSVLAPTKTKVYIDGTLIGETPIVRLPIPPGPHELKAIGPKKQVKELDVTIIGGQDTEQQITW